jgi:crossover junction endodeoxyribonuclease RuvC
MKTVMGIDPGSIRLGFALLEVSGSGLRQHIKAKNFGIIEPGCAEFNERLGILLTELHGLFEKHKPSALSIERVFLGKNVDSVFKLGHARGLVIAIASQLGIPIFEYAAREVKKGVTGSGAADKAQVQVCVLSQLKLRPVLPSGRALPSDATDALALALHHARLLS